MITKRSFKWTCELLNINGLNRNKSGPTEFRVGSDDSINLEDNKPKKKTYYVS
jgi:hypothetical protein